MEKSYTIGEVAQGFGKERRTIERWLIRAQMMTGDDAQDGRIKLLSRAQVDHLAQLHRTTFTPPKPLLQLSAEAQLAPRLDVLRADFAAQFAAERRAHERETSKLRAEIAELKRQLEKLAEENALQTHQDARQTALPVAEDDQETLKRPAIPPEMLAKVAEKAPQAPSAGQQTVSSRAPDSQHRASEMGVQYFAILHRLKEEKIRDALQLDKRHQYLTQAQRTACFRRLHESQGFKRCDGCPAAPDGEHA